MSTQQSTTDPVVSIPAFANTQISVRLDEQELGELNRFYFDNIGEPELSQKKSFLKLLDMLYKGKRTVENPETKKQLDEANDKVESLSKLVEITKQEKETLSDRVTQLTEETDRLRQQLDDTQLAATEETDRLQEQVDRLQTSEAGTIKLTDPELVSELKLIQLALEVQMKQKDDFNTLVKRLIGTCRKVGTFVISPEKRKQFKALIR